MSNYIALGLISILLILVDILWLFYDINQEAERLKDATSAAGALLALMLRN